MNKLNENGTKRLSGRVLAGAVLVSSAAVVTATAAGAQTLDRVPYQPHFWDGGWGFGAMMVLGPLSMILFLAAIIAVVVLLVRWLGDGSSRGTPMTPGGRNPLDILEMRFARGEIDQAEFEERKRSLSA